MTEVKVSSKTPATTAKKSKGDKERDVITKIKDLFPKWEIQKVEAFCAEHGHDLDKIHQALDGSFERTGHQPDDWQVMTKKEQKPKRGGRTEGGSREPRESPRGPREDRPRGERGGRGRGGESRGGGRGRGGGDRRGRGGGGARSKDTTSAPTTTVDTTTTEPVVEAWGTDGSAQIDAKPDTTATVEWGASSSPVASAPVAAVVAPIVPASRTVVEPTESKMTWAQKMSASAARKAKVTELQSAEAFPPQQSQQVLGPAVVHVQPLAPTGPSYRAALQGNTRWGKKAEPVVESVADTSMISVEQQTAALAIDSYQPADSYVQVDDNNIPQNAATSDVLNSIPDVQETVTSSFPQAEVFQPEPSFQSQPQPDAFQIYQSSQNQPSVQSVVSDPKVQSVVYVQAVSSPSDFSDLRATQSFSNDNSGKLVIDLLSATNSVILPQVSQEPLSYEIQFGSFGQPVPPTNFVPVQPEPVQQPEPKAVAQQQPIIEQTPAESQPQLSQPSFASTLREDSLPPKQTTTDNSGPSSQFSAQNQFYQSQNQQTQAVPPPQSSQPQPASGYRGPPPSGSYDPHYAYPFPYESSSPYYNDFAARDTQPQSYQNYDQYSSQFRGGAAGGSGGGSRRPATNANQPYYPSPTARGGLLGSNAPDGSTGSTSPPTSEPVSPNSASKSASFPKPATFAANKPPFTNPPKIPPQIPTYTKPAAPVSGYNKPPATTTPAQKPFKPPSQPQGSQSQHHPDPQHYMYPGVYAGYPYPYPYQPPGQPMPPGFMHPQMPYAPYDPRYGYPYPGPVQPFEGEYEYSKPPAHYGEGGSTPRGAGEWSGNADGQKPSNNASAPSANAPSTNSLPSMNSGKNTVAPGANKKPARFEYEQDPHFNSAYGFQGAPASSPMAMHAAAAPYQPSNYGQPILHPMGGQAPYGGGQYEAHPRGYAAGSWQ